MQCILQLQSVNFVNSGDRIRPIKYCLILYYLALDGWKNLFPCQSETTALVLGSFPSSVQVVDYHL